MAKTSKPKAPKAGAKAPVSGRPTHVVLRIIQGAEGGDIYAGTPEKPVYVDARDWANAPLLEQSGHLRRITPEECDALEAARPGKEETSTEEPKIPATHELDPPAEPPIEPPPVPEPVEPPAAKSKAKPAAKSKAAKK